MNVSPIFIKQKGRSLLGIPEEIGLSNLLSLFLH
jgi:hypothetical protein